MEDSRSPDFAVSLTKESANGKAVFSGVLPKFDPAAASPGDYADVFGDLDDSSSIPFLDLPLALDGLDVATLPSRGSGFDYSEVFGGGDPQGCTASYEEISLVVPRAEYACSSSGRCSLGMELFCQLRQLKYRMKFNKPAGTMYIEERCFNALFKTWSTEESTSSHKARKESKQSPAHSSGSHMEWEEGHHLLPNSTSAYNVSTQISASYRKSSRGITEGAMSCETNISKLHAFPSFSFVVDSDTTTENGHLHKTVKDGLGNENELEATFSNTSKNSLRADRKHPTAKSPASGNDNAHTSNNSSFSGISTTSGIVPSCDGIVMNASEFSLPTQPKQVSPPAKSPLKFVDKKGHPEPRILSSPKICMHNEVGDSSATAAASAAVIEAIEFAQAKLKIAKELMEKKRDGSHKNKKLGRHESLKRNEQKLGQAREGQESFVEMLVALEKKNGTTSAAKNAEKENARALNKEEEQAKKEKDLELCALHKSSESKCMLLKMNDKYHELVNSEKNMTEDVSQTEDLIETTKVIKQNDIVNDSLSSAIESNRKLNKSYITPMACTHSETDFLEAQGCDVKEVVLEAQGVLKAPCSGEKTPFACCEKNIEHSDISTLHYSHDDKEENITVGLSSEASEEKSSYNFVQIDDENEKSELARPAVKEINKSRVGYASNDEEMLNEISETAAQLGIQVPQELCISYQQATEASCMHIVAKKTNSAENQNDTENEMGGTQQMHKEGKGEEIHMKGLSCSTIENELRLEIGQETDVLEKDLNEWNSTVETHRESNTTVKATKAECWSDCNVDKASEILDELQQKYEKEDSTPELSGIVDLEGNNKDDRYVQVSGKEGTIEVQVDRHFMDKIVCANAVPGIYTGPLDMSLGFQSIILSDNRGELPYLTVVTVGDQLVTSRKNILDINKINQNKIESMKEREQMEKPVTKKEENERLFEEANEKKRKLAEDKRKRLSEQAKYMEKEIEEGKKREWLLEKEAKRESKLKEAKEQERLLEAAKEMNVELVEEEQARLIKVQERQKEGQEEQLRSLQAAERERKLEEKDSARLFEEAKETECKVEEERERLIEEDKVSKRKLQKVNGNAKTSEEHDLKKGENRLPLERETHEAQKRSFTEARESTVQNYIHTVISEAPGKLFVEDQVKAEKSSYEYLKKTTEKASVKSILIRQDTAVELITTQVHEYATERVFAETVASDYDKRHNTTPRDSAEKKIVTEENLISKDEHFNLDDQGNAQSLGPDSLNNSRAISETPDGQQSDGEPALKCQFTIEKNQRIAERAAKALAEMNMREDLAQKELAERNRLGEYLDADIGRWSYGKEGNLRALLSTLQYILGPDSGWQPVSLMDILAASAVKRVYRKATLCVHPDKLQQRGASVQEKYICEKVFDLLKDAWNKFNLEDR